MKVDSKVKHTPGPWTHIFDADGDHAIYFEDVLIAVTSGTPRMSLLQDEANARLIAAAPDLLKALEMTADDLREFAILLRPSLPVTASAAKESLHLAEAAIQLAKGESL